jgi:hypothetical protein
MNAEQHLEQVRMELFTLEPKCQRHVEIIATALRKVCELHPGVAECAMALVSAERLVEYEKNWEP